MCILNIYTLIYLLYMDVNGVYTVYGCCIVCMLYVHAYISINKNIKKYPYTYYLGYVVHK